MSAITLTNICKSFGETKALSNASLDASLGEVHAIVGENGSGKSTIAKVISGVLLPDSGTVEILGLHPTNPVQAKKAGISTIYQEMMLAEDLTIYENVFAGADGLFRKKISIREKRDKTVEILKRLALVDLNPDATVSNLPLATKQWLVIARSLLQKPKVLVFDESSAALDLDSTNRLHREMLSLKEEGSCVVIVTHRIAELVKVADSATILRDGETVGTLKRDEMTEANLLRLMSSSQTTEQQESKPKRVISAAVKPVIRTEDLVLSEHADPINFKLDAGEIVGIAGLDGAGQAAFVRTLAGIDQAREGSVVVNDTAIKQHSINSITEAEAYGITYVSGDRKRVGIFPNLSIQENFGMSLLNRTKNRVFLDKQKTQSLFAQETERFKIKFGRQHDRITTLSGGNQQKVLISRAFAADPRVIILNDPTRGVDIGTKQELYRQLRKFADNGGSIVYLSSEIEEFFGFADRADVFFNNTIYASMSGKEINEANLLAGMFGQTSNATAAGEKIHKEKYFTKQEHISNFDSDDCDALQKDKPNSQAATGGC